MKKRKVFMSWGNKASVRAIVLRSSSPQMLQIYFKGSKKAWSNLRQTWEMHASWDPNPGREITFPPHWWPRRAARLDGFTASNEGVLTPPRLRLSPSLQPQTVYDEIQLSRLKTAPLSFYQELPWRFSAEATFHTDAFTVTAFSCSSYWSPRTQSQLSFYLVDKNLWVRGCKLCE